MKIWIFITKHADMYNSLVAPVAVLAEECGCHTRTVRRATKLLEDRGFLVIVKIGTSNAYIVDAEAVWGTLDEYKKFCCFTSKTIAPKDATLRKRLTLMLQRQPDLFPDEEEDDKK